MSIAADHATASAAVVDQLAGERLFFVNKPWEAPTRTGDPDAPASFYSYEGIEYGDTDDADFGGGELREGEVVVGCWVEPGCGEKRLQEMVDVARALFDSADVSAMTFLRPTPEFVGFRDFDGELWYGWLVRTPFIAQG